MFTVDYRIPKFCNLNTDREIVNEPVAKKRLILSAGKQETILQKRKNTTFGIILRKLLRTYLLFHIQKKL